MSIVILRLNTREPDRYQLVMRDEHCVTKGVKVNKHFSFNPLSPKLMDIDKPTGTSVSCYMYLN